jgi:uncharacterized repeat protein (TIGR01451 family)
MFKSSKYYALALVASFFVSSAVSLLFPVIPVYAAPPAACTAGGTVPYPDHNGDPDCAGKVQYRIIYKSIDCINNTADFEVQVKSDSAYPQPIMGDYNIRIGYDTTVMTRIGTVASQSSLISRNRYANGSPANDTSYGAQNLNGSAELVIPGPAAGILSINGFHAGLPGDVIPTTFTTVSTIRMNIVNLTAPLSMDMHDASSFPTTGNSVVIEDVTNPGNWDLVESSYEANNIDLIGSTRNILCTPLIAVDDTYSTLYDASVIITPLTGDTPSTTLKSINGTNTTSGFGQTIVVPNGSLTIAATGLITFMPTSGFTGITTFPYVINDSNSNTATANQNIYVAPAVNSACYNVINNGSITNDLTYWTAQSTWAYNNSTAAFTADTQTNQTIKQSILGYVSNAGQTIFKIELQPAEANNLTTYDATLDISFGGVKYLSINNPIGTGLVTYTATNGATYSVNTTVRNQLATIYLAMPTTTTIVSDLEFKHVAGDDDWYIYSVATEACPKLELDKESTYNDTNNNGVGDVGETIDYKFTVKNTGNVDLTYVIVSDTGAMVSGFPILSLPIGATDSTSYTGTYIITAADIVAGFYQNTATVSGYDPAENPVTDDSNDPKTIATPNDPTRTLIPQFAPVSSVRIDKKIFKGHDSGAGCATAVDELVIVDKNQTLQPITWCFSVTNTGQSHLSNVIISDPALSITQANMTLLIGTLPLAPGSTAVWYYQMSTKTSINNDVTVSAAPSNSSGIPLLGVLPVSGSDIGSAKIIYVFDPPFGIKTGAYKGNNVVRWTMVWINDSGVTANNVVISDEPPIGTTYAGNLVCSPRGTSVVVSCAYQVPSPGFPRGRIVVTGNIAPNPGVSNPTASVSTNALEISFDNLVPASINQVENQAVLDWNPNNDPNPANAFRSLTKTNANKQEPTKLNLELARSGMAIANRLYQSVIIIAIVTIIYKTNKKLLLIKNI